MNFVALGILEDFDFVIKVLTFSYMLFWLYMSFRDIPILFGISSLVGFYFLFINPPMVVFVVILLFSLVLFGNQLQMIMLFGFGPLYSVLTGKRLPQPGETAAMLEAEEMQAVEQKIMQGHALSAEEQQKYGQMMQKQFNLEQGRQQLSQQQRMRPMG